MVGYSELKNSSNIQVLWGYSPLAGSSEHIYVSQRGPNRFLFFHSPSLCDSTQNIAFSPSPYVCGHEAICAREYRKLALKPSLTSLSGRDRRSNRSTRCSTTATLLALVVMLHHLANMGFALSLISWSFDAVERVGWFDQDRVVNHDLRICPTGWEAESCEFPCVNTACPYPLYLRPGDGIE
jgi:hypothetical protein